MFLLFTECYQGEEFDDGQGAVQEKHIKRHWKHIQSFSW
jgi:hypothetical protein